MKTDPLDELERLLNETWTARMESLAIGALSLAHQRVVDAVAQVPRSSRGRPAGNAASFALTAAIFADAINRRVEDQEIRSPQRRIAAAIEVAFLAGMIDAAGRLAADKARCGNRRPQAIDALVEQAAALSLSAPAAARILKTKHRVNRASITLERKIRERRKAPKP